MVGQKVRWICFCINFFDGGGEITPCTCYLSNINFRSSEQRNYAEMVKLFVALIVEMAIFRHPSHITGIVN